MKKKILIVGKGFIGTRLQEQLGCAISDRIIRSFGDIQEELDRFSPKIVINCVGYTGRNNVDDCETDKDMTLEANAFVPVILAEAALRNNLKFIHVSSGCIYNFDYRKDNPIVEKKIPDYFDLFYSRSKIYSERAIEVLADKFNVLITRIRVPLDNRPHQKNILDKLVKYKKVIDVPNSITYLPNFIDAVKHLITVDARGIFNVVNKTPLRYPFLMEAYKRYVPGFRYEVIPLRKLALKRTNLIMSTAKLKKSGFKMPKIEDILDECVRSYINYANFR